MENVSGNNQATITQLTNSTWNFISDQDNLTISTTGAANVGAGSSFTSNGPGNVTFTNNGARQIFGANTALTAKGTGILSVTGNYSILVGTVAINSGATMLLGNGGSTNGTANQTGAVTDNGTWYVVLLTHNSSDCLCGRLGIVSPGTWWRVIWPPGWAWLYSMVFLGLGEGR